MKKKSTLSGKIRLLFFSLIFIFFAVLFGAFASFYRSGMRDSLLERNSLHVSYIESEVFGWLEVREKLLFETGIMIEANLDDSQRAQKLLDRANDFFPEILWFYFGTAQPVNRGGAYIDGDYWVPDDDWNHVERPWFLEGSQSEEVSYTEPYYDTETNKLVVSLAKKVISSDNRYLGVMALDLTLNTLSELVLPHVLTERGSTYLIDDKGYFIIHEDPEKILKSGSMEPYGFFDQYPQLEKFRNQIFKEESFFSLDGSSSSYVSSRRNSDTGWILVSVGPLADIYRRQSFNLLILASIMVLFLILAFFVILILARRIATPVKNIAERLNDIASGEGDLTRELKVASSDEVGRLSGSFNLFVSNLRGMVERLTSISRENLDAKDTLVASEEETAASMTQISANIKSISEQINNLDIIAEESDSSLKLIQKGLTELNNDICGQATAVEESTASITEMVASLNNVATVTNSKYNATNRLVDTAREGSEIMEQAVDSIHDVSNNIEEIMNMANVIASIASQTNLLAMNAAIEAAHAGESGKGFAVVADEIRKLAESSAQSSGEIQKTITGIAGKIEITVDRAGKTREAFVKVDKEIQGVAMALSEITESTKELSIGGQEIQASMETLNRISNKVNEGSQIINEQHGIVTSGMSRMNQISRNVSGGISEIIHGTDEVLVSMSALNRLSSRLADLADKMDRELGRFKTA